MKTLLLLPVLFLALVGCDKRTTKLQYAPDMADSATIKSHESILPPPENAVAMDAVFYSATAELAETEMNSPLEMNNFNLAAGKKHWNTYCALCHGPNGKGNMTLTDAYQAKPPSLVEDVYKKRGDGYFFHKITFGTAIMPAYGQSTDTIERWQIVQYLRSLQNRKGG